MVWPATVTALLAYKHVHSDIVDEIVLDGKIVLHLRNCSRGK